MKRRDCIIMGILSACVAVAGLVWYEMRTMGRMHEAVEAALEQNRNYEAFTTDSVLRRVVDYYDHPLRFWVSSNERLRAHYALGCAYRDLHEAPMALLSWEDAIACADTTSASCDFSTLFRVYGQMEEVYYRQYMPEKELEAQQKFCDYALLAGDTLVYIRGLLQRNEAYLSLGDTAAVFRNIEIVRNLYLERGLTQEAAQVYPSAYQVALERGEYAKADSMMRIYEQESGLFDEYGNIARSREIYYYDKGRYYLATHQLDSAEHLFRRLLAIQANQLDAYQGLMYLFRAKNDLDSCLYYSRLYDGALATYLNETSNDAIAQAQAMYDYSRQEKTAKEEQRKNRYITTVLVAIIILTVWAYLYYRRRMKAKAEAMRQLEELYSQKMTELEDANGELRYMRLHLKDLEGAEQMLAKKEEMILKLEAQVADYATTLGKLDIIEREKRLMSDEAVKVFFTIYHPYSENGKIQKPRAATQKEWNALIKTYKREHLSFYIKIIKRNDLTEQEVKVACLSRLGLLTLEMATLMGCSSQSVSNARTKISEKVFDQQNNAKLNQQLIEI